LSSTFFRLRCVSLAFKQGGGVNVLEFGFANEKGEWIIEGHGVDPDIEVDNDPKSEIAGRDPQLERGIAEVMAKLKNPVKLSPRPHAPVKTPK
jgi:tricorn protease